KLANIGEYEMLVYLHYDESSGDYPDCNLENDTLHLTIINAGLPEVDLGPDMESGSPDTIIIDAGGFETYTWNTGATTSAITGMDSTFTYVVTVTDIYSCIAEDEITITLVSIEELAASYESINVYPNPNNGEFTLHVENKTFADISYELVDMNGRVISSKQSKATHELHENISMTKRAKGVYFLKVFNGKDYAVQKIIVQ
ncbi:MAG: T9SS type A sorting domain-containing protein, partial [Bacteroidota bacterium]|nr:T9SS type A sorting domain-containing protein [Bacteroidota bacterium]